MCQVSTTLTCLIFLVEPERGGEGRRQGEKKLGNKKGDKRMRRGVRDRAGKRGRRGDDARGWKGGEKRGGEER